MRPWGMARCKLYRLECKRDCNDTVVSNGSVSESDLWCQRLGHISEQSLKTLHKRNLLSGMNLPIYTTSLSYCDSCATANLKWGTFDPVGKIVT